MLNLTHVEPTGGSLHSYVLRFAGYGSDGANHLARNNAIKPTAIAPKTNHSTMP